jgi:hypothetical protein
MGQLVLQEIMDAALEEVMVDDSTTFVVHIFLQTKGLAEQQLHSS